MKSPVFVDTVTVHATAGNGGDGCVAFRREKFIPKGGPAGGDGGRGGDVILRGSHDINSLVALYYAPHQRAENGRPGLGKQMHGRNGKDCIASVPCGTEVWNTETGELIGDIVKDRQEMVVARGGKGGLGNCHWKTSTHQSPTEHTEGEDGAAVELRLTLKLMADAGLVGFPNAGKSSLLTQISDAHPKVGAYPFTTLNPVIGTLIFDDYTRMTVADIPGLLKGAHEGAGLGHAFLRHIERAAIMIYVIDMAGVDGRDPTDDYLAIKEELRLHDSTLIKRPCIVVANKMDLPESQDCLRQFIANTGIRPVEVSALEKQHIPELKREIHRIFRDSVKTDPPPQNG